MYILQMSVIGKRGVWVISFDLECDKVNKQVRDCGGILRECLFDECARKVKNQQNQGVWRHFYGITPLC